MFLDNGAYEKEVVDIKEYLQLAVALGANVITAPDVLEDGEETRRRYVDFAGAASEYLAPEQRLMYVVQEAKEADSMFWARRYKEVLIYSPNSTWIAFPRLLGAARPYIIHQCKSTVGFFSRHIHAFGWTGTLAEVSACARIGVHSMDSSGPVWRGLHWWQFGDDWEDIQFDPNFRYSSYEHAAHMADENLDRTIRAANSLQV